MAITRMNTACPAFLAATWLAVALTPAAKATPIEATYTTVGVIGDASLDGSPVQPFPSDLGPSGITGTPVISFQGVNNGSLTEGQTFNLGQFVVNTMAAGTATTYTNVPFEVAFTENSVTAGGATTIGSTVVMHGFLNGTLTAGSPQRFAPYFEPAEFTAEGGPGFPTTSAVFPSGSLTSGISLTTYGNDGQMVQGVLYANHNTPEPSTLAIYAVAAAALAARRFRKRRT